MQETQATDKQQPTNGQPPSSTTVSNLRPSDTNAALIHFYRGEMGRANIWRTRLDTTTNWAVITTGATLTLAFGSVNNPPIIIIVNTLLILLFLVIETRRDRYYELWMHRIRIMEHNFFPSHLSPGYVPPAAWRDELVRSLQHPQYPITFLEAFGRRYRRNYAPIFLILAACWLLKIYIHPAEAETLAVFVDRASIGAVSGWFMIAAGVIFHLSLMFVGLLSIRLNRSSDRIDHMHASIGQTLSEVIHPTADSDHIKQSDWDGQSIGRPYE